MFQSTLRFLPALLLSVCASALADTNTPWPDGHWRGALNEGEQRFEIVYHIQTDGETLSGSMDVPAQGVVGLPLRSVAVNGDQLLIEMPLGGEARFQGSRNDQTIEGTFFQAGQSFPMVLARAEAAQPPGRPQEPLEPLPYSAEQVSFENAGSQLIGTLTQPDSQASVAGVVLVAGAGPHDRDGTFMGHRPLLVMADQLTRAGFAVLRFDERGVGESEGTYATATADQLAGDIAAAVDFLRANAFPNGGQVGLIAHSEGGRIAALAVESQTAGDFVVLLGAPARPGIDDLRAQVEQSPNPIVRLQAAMANAALQTSGEEEAEPAMRGAAADLLDSLNENQRSAFGGREEMVIDQLVQALGQAQARFALQFDPRPALGNGELPVLALYGDKDRQIDAQGAAQAWQAALGDDAAVETLAGLNHFFQHAETGAPSEYAGIEQTLAPEVLSRIIGWLKTITGGVQ